MTGRTPTRPAESIITRGPTRLTSTAAERAELYAAAQAEALQEFGTDEARVVLSIVLDWLWQASKSASRGYGRWEPGHEVREPKPRAEPIGVEVDAGRAVKPEAP